MSNAKPPAIWKSGPWTDAYEFVGKLGDGGQGYTFRAQGNSDQTDVAVKILRADRDTPKARRRMFREVNSLRTLAKTEAFVPQFIESNIDDAIEDKAVHPYVVMEFIDGPTLLTAQRKRGVLPIADAIEITTLLLDTATIAHSEDTAHRDIKPQNIVLKGGDYSTPYLIDFGLSFNSIVDLDDGLTSIRESIGNRFLTLPESESTGSELKHEIASDLTLISGIFFFVLTDKFPEFLSRETANSPHRRNIDALESLHSETLSILNQFFDRAFQYDVYRRLQTSEELRERLKRILDQSEGRLPDIDPIAVAKEIREHVAAESRTYQLDSIEQQHDGSLNEFITYLDTLSRDRQLRPIKLTYRRQQFGQREFNDQEVIRSSIIQVEITIPSYYEKGAMCRYYLGVDGGEIAVAFQEVLAKDANEVKQLKKTVAEAPPETLFTFYKWDGKDTLELRRHFGNWFDKATRALTT